MLISCFLIGITLASGSVSPILAFYMPDQSTGVYLSAKYSVELIRLNGHFSLHKITCIDLTEHVAIPRPDNGSANPVGRPSFNERLILDSVSMGMDNEELMTALYRKVSAVCNRRMFGGLRSVEDLSMTRDDVAGLLKSDRVKEFLESTSSSGHMVEYKQAPTSVLAQLTVLTNFLGNTKQFKAFEIVFRPIPDGVIINPAINRMLLVYNLRRERFPVSAGFSIKTIQAEGLIEWKQQVMFTRRMFSSFGISAEFKAAQSCSVKFDSSMIRSNMVNLVLNAVRENVELSDSEQAGLLEKLSHRNAFRYSVLPAISDDWRSAGFQVEANIQVEDIVVQCPDGRKLVLKSKSTLNETLSYLVNLDIARICFA